MAEKFDVLEQVQTVGALGDGTYGDVVRVKYRAKATDVVGTVDVPMAAYNAENVARAILARVAAHDEVADL